MSSWRTFCVSKRILGGFKGVILVIDEVENLIDRVDFGSLMRATVDTQADQGFANVHFVVSGADDVPARIIQMHQSTARVAEALAVGVMPEAELWEIVLSYLEGTGVSLKAFPCDHDLGRR